MVRAHPLEFRPMLVALVVGHASAQRVLARPEPRARAAAAARRV